MLSHLLTIWTVATFFVLLSGCSLHHHPAQQIPIAEKICLSSEGINEPGLSFLKRKTSHHMAELGFQLVESECEVTLFYTALNHGQWEMLDRTLLRTKSSSSWRTEGVMTLKQGEKTIIEDERVDLRDYGTMQDLLEALAESFVDIVDDYYQSPTHLKN